MAIATLYEFPGMDQRQYDALMEELDFSNQPTPGLLLHVSGPQDESWRTIEVWESEETWQAYFDQNYAAAVQRQIQTFHVTFIPVHNVYLGQSTSSPK
jgi:quinol monooxygenase YgiN